MHWPTGAREATFRRINYILGTFYHAKSNESVGDTYPMSIPANFCGQQQFENLGDLEILVVFPSLA